MKGVKPCPGPFCALEASPKAVENYLDQPVVVGNVLLLSRRHKNMHYE
jgi:hypothetical protein